jgi:hypothetical protein
MTLTLEELEKRIKRTEDIEEIKQLQHRYIISLNFTKWDDVVDCFAENAMMDLGEGSEEKGRIIQGKDNIRKVFHEHICKVHTGKEGLFVVNPIVSVEGDKANGTFVSYFMHIKSRGEEPILHWMQGVYESQFIRENGKWKFSVLRWRSRLKYRDSQMMVIP